jgi:hypothetical protein
MSRLTEANLWQHFRELFESDDVIHLMHMSQRLAVRFLKEG